MPRVGQSVSRRVTDVQIIEETALGYKVTCGCGAQLFTFRTDGVVECLKCGRSRDPARLCEKWGRDRAVGPVAVLGAT